ncbi:hypothetical protein BD779DRAFT_1484401 [Infundibulicybe gibba]|nr:hypothetical protein BD779DRAFT_1484401 [Infundibulicybe gibba]
MPSIEDSKCVLVTGATAGIGRALALSIAKLNTKPKVIAAGRREDRLEEMTKAGLSTTKIDLDTDKDTLKQFVNDLLRDHADLRIPLRSNINYTSIVTLINFLLPHFLKLGAQGRPCFIIPVTSGLGIVPAPWVPNYSATKAALHSFGFSLRGQLEGTNVHVMEIIPPLVESELHDPYGTTTKLSKFWMPLEEYIPSIMQGLREGRSHIADGMAKTAFDRFDEGKFEMVEQAMKVHSNW